MDNYKGLFLLQSRYFLVWFSELCMRIVFVAAGRGRTVMRVVVEEVGGTGPRAAAG